MDNKSPDMFRFLDGVSEATHGRSRSACLLMQTCVGCGKPAKEFRDDIHRQEYKISVYCQECQDKVFKEPEDNEEHTGDPSCQK